MYFIYKSATYITIKAPNITNKHEKSIQHRQYMMLNMKIYIDL